MLAKNYGNRCNGDLTIEQSVPTYGLRRMQKSDLMMGPTEFTERHCPSGHVTWVCPLLKPAQPVDATLIVNIRDRGRVLMSENIAQASLGPEKRGALTSLAAGDLESD